MKITRREFIQRSSQISATAMLSGVVGLSTLTGCSFDDDNDGKKSPPNILLIMVDQMQTPPEGYEPDEGPAEGLKEILGFRTLSQDNPYTQFFPGLLRLRQNAVVMRKHYTASAACVPSRTSIMTGQYPSVTGVDQTEGIFKTAGDIPWLDPEGTPTIGDWFRAVGYKTHYFGKWHVSDPENPEYLEPWGFADWEQSAPEPHGGTADNLGVFRDVEFADKVVGFLDEKGSGSDNTPWFAVGSLVNPHDCGAYPVNWQVPEELGGSGVVSWNDYPPAVPIPSQGDTSRWGGVNGTNEIDLNPDGFPQENSTLPRTYSESLDDKPQCQKEYALKWGLAMESCLNSGLKPDYDAPFPFQLQGEDAEAWSLRYNQFYFYCQYLADLQIRRMLQALDDNGLTDNTIIVFLSDHGEMTGAHGGMVQKWHQAYEEAIRVPMVMSSPLLNKDESIMREIQQPTSSIDFAPTVLALAGYDQAEVLPQMEAIHGASVAKPFAGADLSSHIKGTNSGTILGSDGTSREGVFFMTNDMITERGDNPEDPKPIQYAMFEANVRKRIGEGFPLTEGPVRQPNNVRALCTGDWKIVRYVDPTGFETDEWELYCLTADPIEQTNLVDYRTGEIRDDVTVPGMTLTELQLQNTELKTALAGQEAAFIGKSTDNDINPDDNTWTDPLTGMVFVWVEGGCFQMGSDDAEADADELPLHEVCVDGFWLGKYEVTQDEWQSIMSDNPSRFEGGRKPLELVSWDDCQAFIQKMNDQSGAEFRLPTEAEWEFAARGGINSQGYTYSGSNELDSVAWFFKNSYARTHNVGGKSPNELGLFDMSGNVCEWCQDWHAKTYYSQSPGNNPHGPDTGSHRIVRGGSWVDPFGVSRVTNRLMLKPETRISDIGFRLVKTP